MPPKSVSFKSIYKSLMPKNEARPEQSTPTHTPAPLVNHSPIPSQDNQSRSREKRFMVDKPLRISSELSLSDLDSELKEYSADANDYLMSPESSGVFEKALDSRQDSRLSMMRFNDKIKLGSNIEGFLIRSPKSPVLSNSIDSLNTTTVDGGYLESNDFDLESECHTPRQELDVSADYSESQGPMDEDAPGRMALETSAVTEEPKTVEDADDENNSVKILVFTDTHLGFREDDIYRGSDAMNTFEELLYIAKHLEVDFILHSGDLFDKNTPSRTTMYRTMDLLSSYLATDAVKVQVDTSTVVRSSLRDFKMQFNPEGGPLPGLLEAVSKESRVPFFVIHGNHDNPTYKNCLSPIDILDVAGLVTYFGRYLDLSNVVLRPILIAKGGIKIALYGLGWIKDERLVELFMEDGVKFERCEDFESCYKVLLIHQNRYPRRGAGVKDYITTDMLPDWFDLVIWGHEHESIKFPQKNNPDKFQVLQLGSTVQTMLVPAELPPKHACLIELSADQVDFYPISLRTSRKFICDEIDSYDPEDHQTDDSSDIYEYLKQAVWKILDNHGDPFFTKLNSLSLSDQLELPEKSRIETLMGLSSCPLVKIKVDGSLYENINPKMLGSSFIGKVANPNDMLKISNKKNEKVENSEFQFGYNQTNIKQQVFSSVEDKCKLSLLLETDLNEAVFRFVTANESQAIMDYVRDRVSTVERYMKEEMKNTVFEPLSEDLYSDLIVKTIQDKTSEDRKKQTPKSYEAGLGQFIGENPEPVPAEQEGRSEESEEDSTAVKKRKKNPRSYNTLDNYMRKK